MLLLALHVGMIFLPREQVSQSTGIVEDPPHQFSLKNERMKYKTYMFLYFASKLYSFQLVYGIEAKGVGAGFFAYGIEAKRGWARDFLHVE